MFVQILANIKRDQRKCIWAIIWNRFEKKKNSL